VADLTGDGKSDLVVTNGSDNTVSVLPGKGDGTFKAQQTYTTGAQPYAVTVADITGDGKPDLEVANLTDGTVSVLQGNGDGTFGPQQTFTAGTRPFSLAVADLSGNGKSDLVVPNFGDGNVGVMMGSAKGDFTGQVYTILAATQTAITAPDITYGAAGSVKVTVSSAFGTPTGNVSLAVDNTTVLTHALVNGSWTFSVPGLDASDHSLSASYAAQGNFGPSSQTGNLHVNKADQTINWSNPTDIGYGTALSSTQLNATVTVVGPAPAGALTYTPALGTVLNAGTGQTLSVTAAATQDYNSATASVTLNVTPAPLTVTVDNQTKVYGAALPTLTGTLTGVVNGDSITVTYSTTATAGSDVLPGGYPVTATLNDPNGRLGNYTVTNIPGTLTITKANQILNWSNPADIVYGTPLSPTQLNATVTVVGPAPAGALQYTPAAGTVLSAGAHQTLSVTVAATQDYNAANTSVSVNVTPAPLTITADSKTKVYGAALPTLTASYRGFVNGDTAASLTTPPTLGTTATAGSHVSGNPYPITASGAADSNYTIQYVAGTLTVTPAPLAITADSKTKAYGAAVPALTASYQGFVNGDSPASLTTPPTLGTAATAASSVGTYAITVGSATSADYQINLVPGRLIVTPVPLTIHADNKSGVAGSPLPVLTASYQGFVNGDTLASLTTPVSLSMTATSTSQAGAYPITASGASDPNYTITLVPGTLTLSSSGEIGGVGGSQNLRWLDQVYLDLLNRHVDPTGQNTWLGALNQGSTRMQVAFAIEGSLEYLTDVIGGYYRSYLHREADAAGLNGWIKFVQAGASLGQVQAGLIGSAEFLQTQGGGTVNGYLNALYENALGRPIDPSGLSAYGGAVAAGATLTAVSVTIFTSPEYYQNFIQAGFQVYLHRSADSFGLNSFQGALQGGATEQLVVAAILGSGEFFGNV
jgi:hypothetical protein